MIQDDFSGWGEGRPLFEDGRVVGMVIARKGAKAGEHEWFWWTVAGRGDTARFATNVRRMGGNTRKEAQAALARARIGLRVGFGAIAWGTLQQVADELGWFEVSSDGGSEWVDMNPALRRTRID